MADADGVEDVLDALELDGEDTVEARFLHDADALEDGHVAVADDGGAAVVAAAGERPALAGEDIGAGLEVEVLGVAVEGVGQETADGGGRIVVHADEVAHVDQHAEVGMVDGGDEGLDAQAVLAEVAVVLDHGLDALGRGVLGDGAAALGEARNGGGEALRPHMVGGEAAAGVVAHAGHAENLGDVHLALHPLDLGLEIAAGALEEIGADGVVGDPDADLVGLGPEFGGEGGQGLALGHGDGRELDDVEAHFLGLRDHLDLRHLAAADETAVAVGTHADLHDASPMLALG